MEISTTFLEAFIETGSPYETPGKKVLFNHFRLSRKKRYTSMNFYIYFKLLLNNIAKKNLVKIFQNGGVIHGGLGCLATGVVRNFYLKSMKFFFFYSVPLFILYEPLKSQRQ